MGIFSSKMVTFQCQLCVRTLKKKQIEKHYQYECRHAHAFECLSCWGVFDRDSVKGHISCTSEKEMYQKGDTLKQEKVVHKQISNNKDNPNFNKFDDIKWSGVRKTAKNILMRSEFFKQEIVKLVDLMADCYCISKRADKDDVDLDAMRKSMLNKLEEDMKFSIDLSKNTIRYKM